MAIDTENKRRSKLGRHVLPNPDGTMDQADRQHKVWKYAGILAAAVVAPDVPGFEWTFPENKMHYDLPINRMHHTLPENRMHHTLPEED